MPSAAVTSSWGSLSRARSDERDRCSGCRQLQHVDAEHGRQLLHRLRLRLGPAGPRPRLHRTPCCGDRNGCERGSVRSPPGRTGRKALRVPAVTTLGDASRRCGDSFASAPSLRSAAPRAAAANLGDVLGVRDTGPRVFLGHPEVVERHRQRALDFLKESVSDETMRAVPTPDYAPGCKRRLVSDIPPLRRPRCLRRWRPRPATGARDSRTI